MFVLLYRMVGGFIGLGDNKTFLTRLRWAIPVAILMAFAAYAKGYGLYALPIAAISGLMAFLGRLIPHASYQADMKWRSILGMSLSVFARLALIVAPFVWFNFYDLAISFLGLLAGPAYYLGWRFLDGKDSGFYFKHADGREDRFAKEGGEWGEVLTGLLVYQAAYAALLLV